MTRLPEIIRICLHKHYIRVDEMQQNGQPDVDKPVHTQVVNSWVVIRPFRSPFGAFGRAEIRRLHEPFQQPLGIGIAARISERQLVAHPVTHRMPHASQAGHCQRRA